MKLGLAIYRSGDRLQSFQMVRNPSVIGRREGCDLVLDSRTVSRRHCELKLKSLGLTIKDLGSRNGTIVNGKAIEPDCRVLVKLGDSIQIGKFTIQVEEASESVAKPAHVAPRNNQPDPDDLLASLDEFIRESTVLEDRIVSDKPKVDLAKSTSAVKWAATKNAPDVGETVSDSQNEETRLLDESSSSGMVESTSETVSSQAETANPIDEAELRRLDLRKRLDSMKAKDSKEAANRALKKLFGG